MFVERLWRSIKYEEVYLHAYDSVAQAKAGIARYISFYNLYSLLQTCLANGIDGYRYLTALLIELPKAKTVADFEALLSWRLALVDR